MWLVQVDEGITESHVFSGLPQATWGRGGGDTEGVYVGVNHKVGDLNSRIPSLSNVA